MSHQTLTAVQKFQEVIAYLFELGYDLALSPENNFSQSPGFETIFGIFGGQEKHQKYSVLASLSRVWSLYLYA